MIMNQWNHLQIKIYCMSCNKGKDGTVVLMYFLNSSLTVNKNGQRAQSCMTDTLAWLILDLSVYAGYLYDTHNYNQH